MNARATQPAEPSRADAPAMFDRIAHRYDLLNRVLSLGMDAGWRRRMARHLPPGEGLRVLDLATGTGDQLFALLEASSRVRSGTGMDLAEEMLARGREKIAARGLDGRLDLRTGDAEAIPAGDATFDACTISFGIRNVVSVPTAFAEMLRILKPGGRCLILEFSIPRNAWVRRGHLAYLRHVLPRVGAMVSGDAQAYRYLNRTIESFPHGDAFCTLMRDAGFVDVAAHPLTLGVVTLYQGDRPHAGHG